MLPRPLIVILRLLLLSYVGVCIFLGVFQGRFIYFPSRAPEAQLIADATAASLEPWKDVSGAIIGWKTKPHSPRAANRLVIFHGNGGNALDRSLFAQGFGSIAAGKAWEVYLFEYPGYGARPGEPGEKAIKAAAESAVTRLLETDSRPVYVMGESLGSGVASYLAGSFPEQVHGVLLVTPFTRLPDVAAYHYPALPVRAVLHETYDNVAALTHFKGPVAFLLAGKDEVVPVKFGRALYDQYAGPKRLWIQEEGGHNTLDYSPGTPFWGDVSNFLLGLK